MDCAGDTAPGGHHPGFCRPGRPPPCTSLGAPDQLSIAEYPRPNPGVSSRDGHSLEKAGTGGAAKASRPQPRREPHLSEEAALPAAKDCPQATAIGSEEGTAAFGKGRTRSARQPRVSRGGGERRDEEKIILRGPSVPPLPSKHAHL